MSIVLDRDTHELLKSPYSEVDLFAQEISSPQGSMRTRIFDAHDAHDRRSIAKIIRDGGIGGFTFNGVYGLFGNINDPEAAEKIFQAKNRPKDRGLIAVYLPEFITDIADLSKVKLQDKDREDVVHDFGKNKELMQTLISMWRRIHALGIILPASDNTPKHIIQPHKSDPALSTVLSIWTEYKPLKELLYDLRDNKVAGLVGTSANLSGQGTHNSFEELKNDFVGKVSFLAEDDFSKLRPDQRKSTSIVDFTRFKPRLHRLGNVSELELREMLNDYFNSDLTIDEDLIVANSR